ncbi:MAG: TolC family protein, partial [Parachlamydiales bacterium]
MKKIFIIISIFLTSCMVGPKIQKPGTDLPIKYEQNGSSKDNALSLDSWWKNFNDEDLNNYINIAIKNNYDLKIAIEKIEQARSIYRIKKADLFPEINLTAQTIRQQISKNLTTSFFQESINQNYFQFGFDAIWELDFFGKLARSKQAAYFSYLQTQDSLLNVYIILLSDVAKTYIDIITLKNKIRINERKLFLQNQIYELNLKKFESGLSSEILEKEQYKIIQSISQDIVNLKTFYKTNINRLAVLLGRIPEDLDKDFNKEKPIPQVAKDIDVGLPSELLRRRPDIRRAENLLYEKTANIGVAVAQLFP